MSTDLASSRVFPDSLYTLRVDCEREIDFDFFDDAPSAPTTPSWSQRGARDSTLGDSDADVHLDDGDVPSPALVGGPTPVDSGSSGLSSSVSLASSLSEAGRPTRGGTGGRLDPAEDAVEEAVKEARDDGELPLEHAEDDVVVGRVTSSEEQQAGVDAGGDAPLPPATASQTSRVSQDERVAEDTKDTVPASDAGQKSIPTSGVLGEAVSPLSSAVQAATTSSPSRSTSPSSSEDSDDSDDDSAGAAVEDVEEDASFGIQELSLTVSHKPHRALSSMTVSSLTAVSSAARRDSAADSEDAYTMDAIKKALRRARPPSSTGSLPVTAGGLPGRSRRLNMSFSNDDARRIQRDNELLLRRIVGQRARQPLFGPAQAPATPGRASPAPTHRCSHAVNRARRGKDIERDNQILLKKIQSVKRSPSQLSMSRSSSSMSGRYSYG